MNTKKDKSVGQSSKIVPMRSVQQFQELMITVMEAPPWLPNWGGFYGPAGRGKSTASAHSALRSNALLFECSSTWSTGSLIDAMCSELNLGPIKGPISARERKIIDVLSDDPVPMIFDEADHLVKKSLIDVIRGISDKSRSPVILIGEEQLPMKLEQFERAHSRVLRWEHCVPCTFEEAKDILKLRAEGILIADDLLKQIVADVQGNTRYIVTNIERVKNFARLNGLLEVNVAAYSVDIYRGKPASQFKSGKRVAA